MENYLEAITPEQGCYVILCGESAWIPRARFGHHLRLSQLEQSFDDSDDPQVMADIIRAYVSMCGVEAEGNKASVNELMLAFARLRELNAWQWQLPFMVGGGTSEKRPPYDYDGRYWAWWIHKLASRYGWSRDQIFDLWPEEAGAYLQEILVSEIDEAENQRALSEVSYKYDKQTRKSHFIPMPKPAWMISEQAAGKEPKKVKIPRGLLPLGNVIDIGGMGLLSGNRKDDEGEMVQ